MVWITVSCDMRLCDGFDVRYIQIRLLVEESKNRIVEKSQSRFYAFGCAFL